MKKNENKYIIATSVMLFIWLGFFPLISGLLFYFTNEASFSWISFLAIINLISLIWWLITMKKSTEFDIVNKILLVLSLNPIGYLLMKKTFEVRANNAQDDDHGLTVIEKNNNAFLADWEKEKIAKKEAKQKHKVKKEVYVDPTIKQEIEDKRLVVRSYLKHVVVNIFKQNPELTNTFKLNEMVKEEILSKDFDKKVSTYSDKNNKEFDSKYIYETLINFDKDEILLIYKQDRVDITIEAERILKKI